MTDEITRLTLSQTKKKLERNELSSKEVNLAYLKRIERLNPDLNAFLLVNKEVGGIPAAVKDVIVTKDLRTSAGSKILEDFIPSYNATCIDRLLAQGIGIIGKTNCDEFAMGSSGENSAYGATRNPWNVDKVPGGSSSGSAAAVSADLCVFALGSDTGGSIRQPASFCGVVGLKPTYGLVSRYGLIAYASSLDTIGPITKTVEDAAIVLEWISGPDKKDSNVQKTFHLDEQLLKAGIRSLKVGLPKEYFGEGLDKNVKEVIEKAVQLIEQLGAHPVELDLPHTQYALPAYYIIATAEASSNLARYDGVRFGRTREFFGEEVKRRIMLGTFALSVGYFEDFYAKAARVRTLIKKDFEQAFQRCDAIVGPVSPNVAWNLGEKIDDPLAMYLSDIYTVTANLAGIPALSIPIGTVDGLPVGLQILGRWFGEQTVLQVGYSLEQEIEFRKSNRPQL
jgi:aspartyl-tRNA(Asn)/glutamyl-tRNA(Gln) amidotransferase subunit A